MKKTLLRKIAVMILCIICVFAFAATTLAASGTEITVLREGNAGSDTPPDKPDGDSQGGGDAPDKPDGDSQGGGDAPDKPDGDSQGGGDAPDKPDGEGGGMSGGAPGGQSSGVDSYSAVNEYTEDTTISGESVDSTGTDENAILNSGAEVVIEGSTVTRNSSDSTGGDNSSFYGVGAAILTTDGTTYVTDTKISTDAKGGAGVFAYGDGVVYVADTEITTSKSTSGGIHAAGGGTLYAWDVTATTEGESSAAIRSDRGGGTMVVDGGTYTSNGTGSPAIYCTADIAVNDATLISNNSEAICIEGLNTLRLYDCDLSGNMPVNEQNDCEWTVILYQSMSGDSEEGCSTFSMEGGTLTSGNGGIFYTTNTESNFYISGVDIVSTDGSDYFLKVTGNSNARGWGSSGANGAECTFAVAAQEAEGDVIWDSISTLDFYLIDGSTLTGAVLNDESNAGAGGSGYANLYISADSTWVVTADSTLTNLYSEGKIVDASGKSVSVVDANGNVLVKGDSNVKVTVVTYSESADWTGAPEEVSWDSLAVARPEILGAAEVETTVIETTEETTAIETEETVETTEAATTGTGISGGAIAGIIIGAVVLIGAVVVIVVLQKKKKNK